MGHGPFRIAHTLALPLGMSMHQGFLHAALPLEVCLPWCGSSLGVNPFVGVSGPKRATIPSGVYLLQHGSSTGCSFFRGFLPPKWVPLFRFSCLFSTHISSHLSSHFSSYVFYEFQEGEEDYCVKQAIQCVYLGKIQNNFQTSISRVFHSFLQTYCHWWLRLLLQHCISLRDQTVQWIHCHLGYVDYDVLLWDNNRLTVLHTMPALFPFF